MKRRSFLAGALAAGSTVALPRPAISAGHVELDLVTSWPKDLQGVGTGIQRFADRVKRLSEGSLTINVFAAYERVHPLEVLDAVMSGEADMYHSAAYYFMDHAPAFVFFTGVPMGLTSGEMNAWIYYGGGQELWDRLGHEFGIKSFLCGHTGTQMGGWFRNEITSENDIRNLRIRIPGLGGEVYKRLGAIPVTLGAGDIYPALESGAIDAAEWVGPWNDLEFQFYKVAPNYYYPGFQEPGTPFDLSINRKIWDRLSATHQLIIETAARAENDLILAEYNSQNGQALDTLVRRHGVKLRSFPSRLMANFITVSHDIVGEIAQSSPLASDIFDSFDRFRRMAASWSAHSETAYNLIR